MSRICLYFRDEPERDRWLPGDRHVRPAIRRIVRGKARADGLGKMFRNLCRGLDRLGLNYDVNLPFGRLRPDDRVGVLGRGRCVLDGYDRPNPIVAGIGLMTHPSEWPTFCDDYPVAAYLQPSQWARAIYEPYFCDRCRVWPVGIDTEAWRPGPATGRNDCCLIYDKIMWDRDMMVPRLLHPIRAELSRRRLRTLELRYGAYDEKTYAAALRQASFMVFLCEHESQGIAYQECLSAGVPILAWDQGRYLDPNCTAWGQPDIAATSVPYFDARCGLRFRTIEEFAQRLDEFLDLARAGAFDPRQYVMENLRLEHCAAGFVDILDSAACP